MFKNLLFKAIGKKTDKEIKNEAMADKIHQQASKFVALGHDLSRRFATEITSIRQKCKNLRETNYKLGLSHIEKGNLSDANFRFSIIIKFWPDFKEAYYQKAYIYMLENEPQKAKLVVNRLHELFPDYQDQALSDLVSQIDLAIENSNQNE